MKTKESKYKYTIQVKFTGRAWRDSCCPRTAKIPTLKLARARIAQMPDHSGRIPRRWRILNATLGRALPKSVKIYRGNWE